MKIVNLCLCGPYNINWGYQENLLSKYQEKNGNEVVVITSCFVNNKTGISLDYTDSGTCYDGNVKIIRLESKISKKFGMIFRMYKKLYESLEIEKPDFIFCHGLQFADAKILVKYIKNHKNVRLVVDNHADFTNTAKDFFGKLINKTLWKRSAKILEDCADKFYGVLPARCDFLHEMYNIPKDKIELLIMGADDEKICVSKTKKDLIREKLNIDIDTKLIVTGGKIDKYKKGVLNLMKVINSIKDSKIILLIFGSIDSELETEFYKNLTEPIIYKGWLNQDDIYDYLCASDLGVFPGRHSVIWEQAAGCGIPSIYLDLPNTKHIDINGNCVFIKNDSEDEIKQTLCDILNDENKFKQLKYNAELASKEFLYSEIAKKSIK